MGRLGVAGEWQEYLAVNLSSEDETMEFKPTSLAEKMLFSTVRLVCSYKNGGQGTGTGFIYEDRITNDKYFSMIVTNKHVVAGATSIKIRFHLGELVEDSVIPIGETHEFEISDCEELWLPHPNPAIDLCAMPLAYVRRIANEANQRLYFKSLVPCNVPSDEDLENLDAIHTVIMIGYPVGLWDEKNNLPILRRGTTASHPRLDFNGMPISVVDVACFPGSSGSPVILFEDSLKANKFGAVDLQEEHKPLFIGVLYSAPMYSAEGQIIIKDVPTSVEPHSITNIPINLGYIIKSREVVCLSHCMIDYGIEQGFIEFPEVFQTEREEQLEIK